MKKIKLALLLLISFAGLADVLASNRRAKFSKTYYGVLVSPNKVKWVTILPLGAICETYPGFACQIMSDISTSTVKALTNAFPLTYSILGQENFVYQY